jgi:hypothetical protein
MIGQIFPSLAHEFSMNTDTLGAEIFLRAWLLGELAKRPLGDAAALFQQGVLVIDFV